MLTNFTMQIGSLGHLIPYPLHVHNLVLSQMAPEGNTYMQKMYDVHTNPAALWFYGESVIVETGDGMMQNPNNVTTDIIVSGEIAMMRIETFMNNPTLDDAVILPFLQEIEDYDHLIIDIRGNPGGISTIFYGLVMSRLISAPVDIATNQFVAGTDIALAWVNAFAQQFDDDIIDGEASIKTAADFVRDNNLTQFNTDNLDILEYVFTSSFSLPRAEDAVDFNGEIWLLVDGRSASASTEVTLAALSTGFATVVGENTHPVLSVLHIVEALPNTGIIWRVDMGFMVDSYGRPYEVYGISPQVPNHPGMNALETVLALIGN
jgi:hypothetical protein